MTRYPAILFLSMLLFLPLTGMFAQGTGWVSGRITDTVGNPVFLANISIEGTRTGTVTFEDGTYRLEVPAGEEINLVISCIGYQTLTRKVTLDGNEEVTLDFQLEVAFQSLDEVSVREQADRTTTLNRINIKTLHLIPGSGGSVEALLKTLPGVASANELSSQYSVRGGNFDENLVYVNGIEVYRPFLIRSGQQEGMSFINSQMVSSVNFSAGGFDASYGDKMSSVLDITYRRPTRFAGSIDMSLLGASVQLEDAGLNGRLTHNSGFRYKTSQYLLSSLETKGEYLPNFYDFQTYITLDVSPRIEVSFLGNAASNSYKFVPENRSTDFGTFQNPLNLVIYYDGREEDRFNTCLGALTLHYRPSDKLSLKFINSGFSSLEEEHFDIQGQYLINELDNTPYSETFGDSILNIGIGTFLNHARNELNAWVCSASHTGSWFSDNTRLKWGAKYQYEYIDDRLSEWEMIDSAGYSIPYSDRQVLLASLTRSDNLIRSSKLTGYVQGNYSITGWLNSYYFSGGIRTSYWDFNRQLLISPRFTFSVKPSWERDIILRFSTGAYHQPPFYKELRYPDGSINPVIRAQKSIHVVLGGDYTFTAWGRPFLFSTEIYYKHLYALIPYKLDNVRIQYAAENMARGYATGLEFKINGEFVKDAESWASLSIMRTYENIEGDYYIDETGDVIEPGYYPRPTDQILNFGLFFQDYFPNNPEYKVNLNFLYGSKLPFSPPNNDRYDQVFRMPSYKRVDIGFSKILKKEESLLPERNPFRFFRSIWMSGEIFNLLGVKNTMSYLWVKTVSNQVNVPGQFAVPNYLTSRRFNLRLTAHF